MTVLPTSAKAAAKLKYPAIEVMVPSLGTEKAMLETPVISMFPPTTDPKAFAPNAIKD